jgi:hypothetical protein
MRNTVMKSRDVYSGSSGPLGQGERDTFVLDKAVVPFVPVLLRWHSPITVIRRVSEVIVSSFDRVLGRWAITHVSVEGFKDVPCATDCYTSTTVSWKVFSFWVKASVLHPIPDAIFRCVLHSMRSKVKSVFLPGRILMEASTGTGITILQHGSANNDGATTYAIAKPLGVTAGRVLNSFAHSQTGEHLAGNVCKIVSRHRNLLERFRCLGGQGLQPLSAAHYNTGKP